MQISVNFKYIALSLILIAISIHAGFELGKKTDKPKVQGSSVKSCIREGQDKLINPLIECEILSNSANQELKLFDDKVQAEIGKRKSIGDLTNIAVYFRDLNNGPWFGINQDENFFPASLIKVPLMIAYFKAVETNTQIFSKELNFEQGSDDANKLQHFKPIKPIEPGKTYTVQELIQRMIIDSDNNAYNLLLKNIGTDPVRQVFKNLGLPEPDYIKSEEVNSVHDYATFWRILYNGSYLYKEDSQKALEILSKTNFSQGIVSGLPSDIKVAHKFGSYIRGNQEVQLHDCGIVYYPTKPYIICVMTRGHDVDRLTSVIQDISRLIYQEIDKQVKNTD